MRWTSACLVALGVVTASALNPITAAAAPEPVNEPADEPVTTEAGAPLVCDERTALPATETPWQQERLDASRAWGFSTGRGVLVAVIDTGVDASVPQLAGKVLPGFDIVNGAGSADVDCHGHGTFVAGIIAAGPSADTEFEGVAPGAVVLPVRQANESDDGTAGDMAASIVLAVDNGASVINVSASAYDNAPVLFDAVKYATDNDVLIIASVSNDAENGDPVAYPAAYPDVIAVGAVGIDGTRSSFSGTTNDVDLVAPGEGVVSTAAGTTGHGEISGTSFAAPFVAGTAALIRSRHPELSIAEVRHRLLVTADHPGTDSSASGLGWGVVNPFRAVTAVLPEEERSMTLDEALAVAMPSATPVTDPAARTATQLFGFGLLGAISTFLVIWSVVGASRRTRTRTPLHRRLAAVATARSRPSTQET